MAGSLFSSAPSQDCAPTSSSYHLFYPHFCSFLRLSVPIPVTSASLSHKPPLQSLYLCFHLPSPPLSLPFPPFLLFHSPFSILFLPLPLFPSSIPHPRFRAFLAGLLAGLRGSRKIKDVWKGAKRGRVSSQRGRGFGLREHSIVGKVLYLRF
jgi:hypothetical protein